MPIVGDVISYTVAPIIGEAIGWPLITKMFAPQLVSPQFEREFPMPLALRPSQIKAFSQDTSHMITAAQQLSPRYRTITCPTVIMAGDADRIVNVERQSQRLHGAIPGSRLDVLVGAGHMIHHLDPARMVRAIDLIATRHHASEHAGRGSHVGQPGIGGTCGGAAARRASCAM